MGTDIGDDTKRSFQDLLKALKRDRQRLQVQLNLGKLEMQEEWDDIEKKWTVLEHHLAELSDDAQKMAHRIGDEISDAYHRLRDRD